MNNVQIAFFENIVIFRNNTNCLNSVFLNQLIILIIPKRPFDEIYVA